MKVLILTAIGYLLGCFSFSIILTKLIEKKDVRDFGSGNAGFTNTLRNFKLGTAVMVFAGDALKAAVAMSLALIVSPGDRLALYGAGIGVILGHNFPVSFKFKGGKGVLVSCVALFFADWRIGLIIFVVSVIIMFATRFVSLGSVTGAVIVPILAFIFHGGDIYFIVFSVVISVLSIYMHRENIKRLIGGNENRFGRNKTKGL